MATRIPWIDPLELAARYQDESHLVLLHNGLTDTDESNQLSLLALGMKREISDQWYALEAVLSTDQPCWKNGWLGWLGYGLKNQLEALDSDDASFIHFPPLWFAQFSTLYQFDHRTQQLHRYGPEQPLPPLSSNTSSADEDPTTPLQPTVTSLKSNMSRDTYLDHVRQTIEMIHAGEFYQANITRKFYGELSYLPRSFELFRTLCRLSPAPYSAYIKINNKAVISSSPECFLSIDTHGNTSSRPIKGTIGRGTSPTADKIARQQLQHSHKDMAENLMIVDLMRNDIARHARIGSVRVNELFSIQRYKTLYHMMSTVSAIRHPQSSTIEMVKGCFPPGSMTGAPKISAMQWCSQREKMERGIYSGAIGWFGGDGSCDLSVVIRTLLIDEQRFEFQVGGGIVADSLPLTEWEETLTKAKAIMALLHINDEDIRCL